MCKNSLNPLKLKSSNTKSFEHLLISISSPQSILVLTIYRPPSSSIPKFFNELTDLVNAISLKNRPLLILGDFNLPNSSHLSKLTSLLSTLNFSQYCNLPTHHHGNILDLVFSNSDLKLSELTILSQPPTISDHSLINFTLHPPQSFEPSSIPKTLCYRDFSSIDYDSFQSDLHNSLSSFIFNPSTTPDSAYNYFHDTLSNLLDLHAPLTIRTVKSKNRPKWHFSDDLRDLKRKIRSLNRKLLKLKRQNLSLEPFLSERNLLQLNYTSLITKAREEYSQNLVNDSKSKAKSLFNLFNNLSAPESQFNSSLSSNELSKFFSDKILTLRDTLNNNPSSPLPIQAPSPIISPLLKFSSTSEEEVKLLIKSMRKSSSPLDPMPPKLIIQHLSTLTPFLTKLFNLCLSSGSIPSLFKHACVKPLLKKPSSDPNIPSNFRPISLLPFISKVLEKLIASRLVDHVNFNDLDDEFQSGFKAFHSTETATLKVSSDLRVASDAGNLSFLVLLDLSAAFDTIDHPTLLNRLSSTLGINSTALNLIDSYLSNRSQSVYFNDSISSPRSLNFGVPQGSVLGPLLFRLYMLPLSKLLKSEGFSFHCYADDTQLYHSFKPNDISNSITKLQNCFKKTSSWLSSNFLKLNDEKTEILLIGSDSLRCKVNLDKIRLGNADIKLSSSARNLGVYFDNALNFKQHISNVCKTSYSFLRNASKIRKHFSFKSFEILIHAFVTSKLDYCNSLLTGAFKCDIDRLQSIQNYACKLLLFKNKFDPVSPLLKKLHWLPISKRIDFKSLLLTYKSLNNIAPSYFKTMLKPNCSSLNLRSSSKTLLTVPRTKKVSFGDRAFSCYAPKLWNTLPSSIQDSQSLSIFKSKLKTYLFCSPSTN